METKMNDDIKSFGDAIPGTIVLTDAKQNILWWNTSAKTLFTRRKPPSVISDLFKIPDKRNQFITRLKPPLNKTLQITIKPYDTGQLFYIQDVSRQHHLEKMRQDFVANVSHELRTPLTVIHGYVEALIDQQQVPQLQQILNQMRDHSKRMQRIIEELLFLSRLENQAHQPTEWHIIDANKMLERIIEEAEEYSKNKNQVIKLHADKNLLVKGVSNQIRSVFSNLIFNAVKYTPANGRIDVTWGKNGSRAVFSVKDSGIGIAKKHLNRLTERFYRVDKGRHDASSTGLGLAIVKHVLIHHRATLNISSELGVGSCFTCIFPARNSFIAK